MRFKITPELILTSARQMRFTRFRKSRAQALAPEIERLRNAAEAAAQHNDFNADPAGFATTLVRLKAPDPRA